MERGPCAEWPSLAESLNAANVAGQAELQKQLADLTNLNTRLWRENDDLLCENRILTQRVEEHGQDTRRVIATIRSRLCPDCCTRIPAEYKDFDSYALFTEPAPLSTEELD